MNLARMHYDQETTAKVYKSLYGAQWELKSEIKLAFREDIP